MTRKKLNNVLALLLAAVLSVGLLPIQASATTNTITFTDVPKAVYAADGKTLVSGHWAEPYITRLATAGVVSGVGQNKFSPDTNVANAEMVKMLVNAFFRNEYNTYKQANSDAMYAHFGYQTYWFSFMCYYAKAGIHLLDGVNVDIDNYNSCYTPMSRYDMAMVLYNTAKAKGLSASETDKAIAQGALVDTGDYFNLGAYKDAVVTCYAMGLLNGKGSLGFCGTDNMTRGEACAVIIRLEDALKNGGGATTDPGTDPDPTPSTPVTPTVKDIAVTTKTNATGKGGYGFDVNGVMGDATNGTSGTEYYISDNNYNTSCLNNGKTITETNVLELMAKAKSKWPTNTNWAARGTNNNWYGNPGTVMNQLLLNQYRSSTTYGCSGFVAMISDYIFGKTSNPARQIDPNTARPGDIIIQLNTDNSVKHMMIVADTVAANDPSGRGGALFLGEGHVAGKVAWAENNGESWDVWNAALPSELGTCVAYTRYPA